MLYDGSACSSSNLGAAHEYLVIADLIRRGFRVFRAAEPNCDCDLMIHLPDGQWRRIEVKTKPGVDAITKLPMVEDEDVFAIVIPEDLIVYIPPLDSIWPNGMVAGIPKKDRKRRINQRVKPEVLLASVKDLLAKREAMLKQKASTN